MFFVFEGIDGSGKSTQLTRLAESLLREGYTVFETAQPSLGKIGSLIRELLSSAAALEGETLALLFAADRLDHLQREILPALARGEIVLCDRYVPSSIAYQTATAKNESQEATRAWVTDLNRHARQPDLTFFLKIDPQTAETRRKARGKAADTLERADLQLRIAQEYERLLGQEHVAEATEDFWVVEIDVNAPSDEIAEDVLLGAMIKLVTSGRGDVKATTTIDKSLEQLSPHLAS